MLCIGRVTVHQLFQPTYLSRVALQTFADLILEVLDFDVLVEVGQQVLDLHHFALLRQLNHIADPSFLHQEMLCDLDP